MKPTKRDRCIDVFVTIMLILALVYAMVATAECRMRYNYQLQHSTDVNNVEQTNGTE